MELDKLSQKNVKKIVPEQTCRTDADLCHII